MKIGPGPQRPGNPRPAESGPRLPFPAESGIGDSLFPGLNRESGKSQASLPDSRQISPIPAKKIGNRGIRFPIPE
jgi:hypothetical protein